MLSQLTLLLFYSSCLIVKRILPASQYQLCLKKKYTARPKEQQLKDMTLTFFVNNLYSCKQK